MKKADIPPAPRRGHGSSRQTLKQKLDRTPGMRLFHEEEKGGAETVVHRTSSATRNFFGSLSGLRQLAIKSSGSWLIRDMSVPADLNGLDTESNASSFGSVNRFGSALDLTGLIGLEEQVVGSQSSNSIFFRSQLDSGSRRNSLGGDLTPRHSRRNSLEGFIPRQCDGDDAEQFALEGMVASADRPEERIRAHLKRVVLVQACARRMLARKHYQAMVKGASTIQHAWRARQKHQQELRIVAVVRIQSYYRQWKCRKAFKTMVDKVLYMQSCARRILVRKHYHAMVEGASTIQHAWRAFSARQKHRQDLEIFAVVKIQSYYRGWRCRKLFAVMVNRVIHLQSFARRMLARKHYQAMVKGASTIQHAWHAFSARQKYQQELEMVAVIRIQTYYRGWTSRKMFKTMVEKVVHIQACARRMLARRHLHVQVKAASTIQNAWRAFSARQKQQELRIVAAVGIQSYFRGWKCRKSLKVMVDRVVCVQSCARRMLARKQYQEHLQLVVKSALIIQHAWRAFNARQNHQQELRIAAAIRIQFHYRRWKCRKLFKTVVARAVYIQACARRMLARKHLQLQVKAASTIQQAWRTFSACQKHQQELEMVGRVVYLQSCARRMLARRHYQALVKAASTFQQAWRTFNAQQKHQQELELVAVVMIQSYYRGWRSRKLYKTMVGRVVYIQSCARRMLARKDYREHLQSLVKGASLIQQAWRTFSARQKHRQELEMVAVVKIQSCYRGWRCRKLFAMMVNRVIHLQSIARRTLARKHYQAMVKGALTIQHAWRARQKHLQELKIVAAVRIQSCFKGWKTRKMFKRMVGRAVYIQACIRRTLATRRYKELRRGTIVLQRRWRKIQCLQVEDKAALKIQNRWRSYKQYQLFQSLRQHRVDCAVIIQRRWRVLQNLRLEKERAVILIQAHFRGRRVRIWLKRTHSAVTCIESAYWSYAQRRSKNERQCLGCEQSSETCAVGSDENYSRMIFLKKSSLCGSNGSLDTFSPKSPLSVANSFVLANEMHNSECGYISSQCSVSMMEDWNNIPIDELDQCLDTCLAALPLSAASSRQRSLAPSRECSSTLDVVSSSIFLDQLDASSTPATPIERTPAPASFRSSEVEQDLVGIREVYSSASRDTIQSGETSSPLHRFYHSPSQKLLVDEEPVTMAEQGEKPVTRSTSKDEERLQHFAEIFLTMRQISLQQQRAQCAPPFPPSVVPPQSPPILDPGAEVSTRTSRYASPMALAPTPASNTGQSDVVLNMEELLKTLEQYCDEESGGCDMVTEGDIESGQNWRVRKTSTPTLGIKHLKLPDVNAVLIVLVAMVVYTRTICREVFFGTRQSPRKK